MISRYRQNRINRTLSMLYLDTENKNMKGVHDDLATLTTIGVGFPLRSAGRTLAKGVANHLYAHEYTIDSEASKVIFELSHQYIYRHYNSSDLILD